MPALWPKFITDVSSYIANGDANSGGPGVLKGQDRPGAEINANFDVKTYVPLVTPSGRRSFGEALAGFYLDAIKTAQTPYGATHTQSPAAQIFIKAYGEIFEQIFRNGEPYLVDQKDADGNVTEQGKESLEPYDEMSTEIPDPPTEEELEAEREQKFCQFLEEEGSRLYTFSYFKFHRIEPGDTQAQIEDMFANRLLQQFEKISSPSERWSFFEWVSSLGKREYQGFNFSNVNLGSGFSAPYINVHNTVKTGIAAAGYNWQTLIDNVSNKVRNAIIAAHPVNSFSVFSPFGISLSDTNPDNIEAAIKRPAVNPIQKPWPFGDDRPEKELNPKRIQVSYNRESPSERPKILTDAVVVFFSWRPDVRVYLPSTFTETLADGTQRILSRWQKTPAYVISTYAVTEYENNWVRTPEPQLEALGESSTFADIKILSGGTLFEFVKWQGEQAENNAAACEEAPTDLPFDYSCYSGLSMDNGLFNTDDGTDPWKQLALATIAYWYSTLIQPFKVSPSALPALIPAPLGGIYIPIYYGSVDRLANNLRRAMHMGQTFSQLPATQPPALAVASALAATYAIHLLEFKLIYLGGIPTPVGPVPMPGFVPVVF
jgi:predicted DNA binding CopG/RHH family protein